VDREAISTFEKPIQENAGFPRAEGQSVRFRHHEDQRHLAGISEALSRQRRSLRMRAVVFDGSTDYHERINDPSLGIDERTILVIRGSGPLGWPAPRKW
jgi:dihydroxy-acid dehydratase